jgi:hypothetical protein
MAQLPMQRFRPQWGPPQFPELPALQKKKEPGRVGPFFDKLRSGPTGDALLHGGLALMAASGPRPQGTTSISQIIGEAGLYAADVYRQSELMHNEKDVAQRVTDLLNNPEALQGLSENQIRILKALPPMQAITLLAGAEFGKDGEETLTAIRDDRGGLVHLVGNRSGVTARTIDITPQHSEGSAPQWRTLPNGVQVLMDSEGREISRITEGALAGQGEVLVNLANDFNRLPEVAAYRDTLTHLATAHEAYDRRDNAGDLTLKVALAKLFDPEARVRPGGVDLVADTRDMSDEIRGMIQWGTGRGGSLTPTQRQAILREIENHTSQRLRNYEQIKAQFWPIYSEIGVRPDLIMGGWDQPRFRLFRHTSIPGVEVDDQGMIVFPPGVERPTGPPRNNTTGVNPPYLDRLLRGDSGGGR